MSIATSPTTFDAAGHVPDLPGFEFVNGRLVEKNVGQTSSFIGGELFFYLRAYCGQLTLGSVFPADASFQWNIGERVRLTRPDVSFVGNEKLTRFGIPSGHAKYVPDLVAEVLSPNDLAEEVSEKIKDYIAAGVRLVWILDPITKQAHVQRPDGRGVILSIADALDGEDVVPGFRCELKLLFDAPALRIKPTQSEP